MTWNSGPMLWPDEDDQNQATPADEDGTAPRLRVVLDESVGFAPVVQGVYQPDVVDLDRALFARVSETHPGVVRTLGVLITELADLDSLAPDLRRGIGDHIRRVGDAVVSRAQFGA